MEARTIVIHNKKGGVGKSTQALHIASGLAIRGYRVGILDMGIQGHQAVMLGLPVKDGLFNVTVGGQALERNVYCLLPDQYSDGLNPSQGSLYLLPGHDMTAEIALNLREMTIPTVSDVVRRYGAYYALDYIIVDTQPTRSELDTATYLFADAFMFVTEIDVLSFDGILNTMQVIEQYNDFRKSLNIEPLFIIGMIPNKFREGTILHKKNIAELGRMFGRFSSGGLVLSPCRLLIAWQEATQVAQMPVYAYAPDSEATKDAWRVVDAVEERVRQWEIQ